ncbi:hypothetical protein SANTM175S_06476 [Streptomyces antimycoticus]
MLALADGLIWAELGASLPGAGGSYVYLRQAFQYRSGKLMPFLFVWTAMLFIPLIMSTGVVGLVQYLGYLWPDMTQTQGDLVGLGVIVLVIGLLWRGVEHIARITAVMWCVMIASVVLVIVAASEPPGRTGRGRRVSERHALAKRKWEPSVPVLTTEEGARPVKEVTLGEPARVPARRSARPVPYTVRRTAPPAASPHSTAAAANRDAQCAHLAAASARHRRRRRDERLHR